MTVSEPTYTLVQAKRELAKTSNQQTWELLQKDDRTAADNENMLLAACSSLYHWKEVGTAAHTQRGSWLLARVYLKLGQTDLAMEWAQKCQRITEGYPREMEEFDLAFAQEILARAYAQAGDVKQAKKHLSEAIRLGEMITDTDDRAIFEADLRSGDWYQLSDEMK